MEKTGVTLILVPSWKQTGNSSLKAAKLWGGKMTHGLMCLFALNKAKTLNKEAKMTLLSDGGKVSPERMPNGR